MIRITESEANDYFLDERLFSDDWLNADAQKRIQALNMATNQINRLKFSKYEDENKEKHFKNAICEQAIYLLQTLNTQRAKLIEQGVTSFSVEGLSESYNASKVKNKICLEAMEYLRPYLLGCVSIC